MVFETITTNLRDGRQISISSPRRNQVDSVVALKTALAYAPFPSLRPEEAERISSMGLTVTFSQYAVRANAVILLAELEDQVVGMGATSFGRFQDSRHRGYTQVDVHPGFRRLGIASSLLETLETFSRKVEGARFLEARMDEANTPARCLLDGRDYLHVATKPDAIGVGPGDYHSQLIYYKYL